MLPFSRVFQLQSGSLGSGQTVCVAAVMEVCSGTEYLQSRVAYVPGAPPSLAAAVDVSKQCADALDRSPPRTAKYT